MYFKWYYFVMCCNSIKYGGVPVVQTIILTILENIIVACTMLTKCGWKEDWKTVEWLANCSFKIPFYE